MSSAIVVGATGILGREIVKQLAQTPEKWKKIYAFSRSKKDEFPSNVVHRHIDLLSSADAMAKELQGVEAEYVFFAAYLQKDSEEENWQVNGDMLHNFLRALELTSAIAQTKRILLVTGAKQYGVHLGQPKNPLRETDPWLTANPPFPPNFYYRQQDILRAFCAAHRHLAWTVTYPNDVIGFATGNFMNLATGLGLYAVVSKELQLAEAGRAGRAGETFEPEPELAFPGSETFYTRFDTFTSSRLHARFCEWAVAEPRAANQAFNVVNGDVQSWQDMWPRLARRFGMRVPRDQFAGGGGGAAELASQAELASHAALNDTPPLSVFAEEAGLVGRVRPSALEQRVSLVKWSQRDDVKKAWARLAEREGLQKDAFEKATWAFIDFVLGRNYDIVSSMSKAREAGWTGYEDTWKSFSDVFGELEAANVLPKTH
ncbi:2c328a9d-3154-4131-bf54-d8c66fa1b544 [Thermothielavioides terrestris]|uniref:2c328a9d-3154-4131-bf54-d8c66fa1b544 n=1 Tax=Thermothielavioides terrestris TaxID=2587410 RepID=A0A446B9J5_9PEZI|nr:2c328a9d-3154-4131-bf54-d8c66fa1b544 [Thermothielavioides terrestris]